MIKKYYIQILLFLILANNQIAKFWEGNTDRYISFSGVIGNRLEYHYWAVFDHWMQPFYFLSIIALSIAWPLTGGVKRYALFAVAAFTSIVSVEFFMYLNDGDNFRNEENYYYFLGAFLVALLIGKKWNGSK